METAQARTGGNGDLQPAPRVGLPVVTLSDARVEGLEDRTLLAVITWSTTAAPNGGDWNAAGNWVGNKVPGPTDTAVIKGFSGVQTVFIDSPSTDDSVISVTTDNTVHLQVESGSLTLSVGSPTTFGGPVEVDTNGTLNINPGAQVTINDEQTLTDNGQVNVTSARWRSTSSAATRSPTASRSEPEAR